MDINMDFIQAQLQRRADQRALPKVAAGAGVGVRTVHRVLATGTCTTTTASKLQNFLQSTQAHRRLNDGGK
jgi:hypothetical protein